MDNATMNAMGPDPTLAGKTTQQGGNSNSSGSNGENDSSILDTLLTAAKMMKETPILEDIVDLIPSFIEIFREVKENKTLLRRLARSCDNAISTLHGSYQRAEIKNEWAARHWFLIKDLQDVLVSIQEFLKEARKKRLHVRILTTWAEKKKIRDYEERLDRSLKQFSILSHLGINEGLDQALRESHELKNLVILRSNSNGSESTVSSTLEDIEEDPYHAEDPDLKDEVEATAVSQKPDGHGGYATALSKPSRKGKGSMTRAELEEELERLKIRAELRENAQLAKKKKGKKKAKYRESIDDEDVYDTSEDDDIPENRGKSKKHTKAGKKKKSSNSNTEWEAEPQPGPSTTWNHMSYSWATNPTAFDALHSELRSSVHPGTPLHYSGFPMPGYFPFPHGAPTTNPFQNQYYPYSAHTAVVTNVGSGNVSFSSISNSGNDYSVNFADADSD